MHWCILQKVSNINNLAFSIKSSKQATRKKSFRRTYKSKKIRNMKILAFHAVPWVPEAFNAWFLVSVKS